MVRVPSSKINDKKRKQDVFDHPYNTRSRMKQQKHSILKDTTRQSRKIDDKNSHQKVSSAPGCSNTVKGKPAAGSPVKKVPFTLYNCIKDALAAREVWESKRDQPSELELQDAERVVTSMTYYYTHTDPVLPLNWKYNPDTAGTIEPIDTIPVLYFVEKPGKKAKTKSFEDGDDDSDSSSDISSHYSSDCSSDCGPIVSPILLRELMDVPLKNDDFESWLEFKKFDEDYAPQPKPVPASQPRDAHFQVNLQHPFINVIGNFAVNCFNKAYVEFVDEAEHNHIRDPAFTDCMYCKLDVSYWFDINILAYEYGFRGIYTARVECIIDSGESTLHRFVLTDMKCGKKGRPRKSKSSKDVRPQYTGMWVRKSSCYRKCPIDYGYDYHNPTEFIEFIRP